MKIKQLVALLIAVALLVPSFVFAAGDDYSQGQQAHVYKVAKHKHKHTHKHRSKRHKRHK